MNPGAPMRYFLPTKMSSRTRALGRAAVQVIEPQRKGLHACEYLQKLLFGRAQLQKAWSICGLRVCLLVPARSKLARVILVAVGCKLSEIEVPVKPDQFNMPMLMRRGW